LRIARPQFGLGLGRGTIGPVAAANCADAFVDLLGIVATQVGGAVEAFPVAADQKREALLQERHENLAGAGLEKKHLPAEALGAGSATGTSQRRAGLDTKIDMPTMVHGAH